MNKSKYKDFMPAISLETGTPWKQQQSTRKLSSTTLNTRKDSKDNQSKNKKKV